MIAYEIRLRYVVIATVGYNNVSANSDHLHVQDELFGQIGAYHH